MKDKLELALKIISKIEGETQSSSPFLSPIIEYTISSIEVCDIVLECLDIKKDNFMSFREEKEGQDENN